MKIAFVYNAPQVYSGSGFVLSYLQTYLSSLNEAEIITLTETPHLTGRKYNSVVNPKYVLNKPKLPARGKRLSKWVYWLLIPKMLRQAKKECMKFKPDAVVGVFPDEYFTWMGYRLAKSLDVPFFPWFHNTYAENRTGLGRILGKHLQSVLFSKSDLVFTMSDGMTEYYQKRYSKYFSKFQTLQHGTTITDTIGKKSSDRDDNRIRIVYMGNLSLSYYEATARLFRIAGNNPSIEIHIFSNTNENIFCRLTDNDPAIVYHGFVEDESEMLDLILQCDLCFVPLGLSGPISSIEYETIFPTRIIGMLRYGLPLLVHAPENSFLVRFVREKDCAFDVTLPDDDLLMETINSIVDQPEVAREKINGAIAASEYFNVKKTGEILMKAIQDSIQNRKSL